MTVVDSMAVPSVLIAEPDPWSRDLLKHVVLSVRCDAQLDVCEEGQQALRLLSQNTYDLVIADGDLPGVGGWTCCVRYASAVAVRYSHLSC